MKDLTAEEVSFGRGGHGKLLRGPGLGVDVAQDTLDRYTTSLEELR